MTKETFDKLETLKHEYQLYLAVEDIDHSKTKARSPQTNGIYERFHKTMKHEFYDITFRRFALLWQNAYAYIPIR